MKHRLRRKLSYKKCHETAKVVMLTNCDFECVCFLGALKNDCAIWQLYDISI